MYTQGKWIIIMKMSIKRHLQQCSLHSKFICGRSKNTNNPVVAYQENGWTMWCIHMWIHHTSIFFKEEWTYSIPKKVLQVWLSKRSYRRVHVICTREYAVWFYLCDVQEQVAVIWGVRSHSIISLVTSGVGGGVAQGSLSGY